jgi:hypothetical protein
MLWARLLADGSGLGSSKRANYWQELRHKLCKAKERHYLFAR